MITLKTTIAAIREQVSSDLAGETVLLNLKNAKYYGFDEVGGRIWELASEPKRVEEIVLAILEEYEVEREQCERDVLAFVKELAGHGLIEVSGGDPSA